MHPDFEETEDTQAPTHLADLTEKHAERPMTLYKGPHSLFRVLSPNYRLNKAEYLQIYNLRPTTLLELDLVIEEVCAFFPNIPPRRPGPSVFLIKTQRGSLSRFPVSRSLLHLYLRTTFPSSLLSLYPNHTSFSTL
jgi:hypothetical protein